MTAIFSNSGEKSPDYMLFPEIFKLIYEFRPNMKFVVLLRDPVERAYVSFPGHFFRFGVYVFVLLVSKQSQYQMNKRQEGFFRFTANNTVGTFEEELAIEAAARAENSQRWYMKRGYYAEQIDSMFAAGFQRDSIHIMFHSHLSDPSVWKRLFLFLEVDSSVAIPRTALQPVADEPYEPMKQTTREKLRRHFKAHDEKLSALLGGLPLPWRQ